MSGIGGASSNYYSASASSNKGMSGLVSGMDTENMVKQMLSGTQSKINKQNQLKQQIEWKQVIYRDIITSINSFRGKYFDTTFDSKLKNNLSSSNFFNSMVSSVKSGDSVKIVGTDSSAFSGDMKIKVSQLASSAKLYSNVKMSGNQTITGSAMDIDKIKKALQSGAELSFDLTLDGVTKSIAISSEDISGEIDADTIKGALETKVGQAFGGYIGISMSDNKLSFSINIKDADNNLEKGHELKITGADAGKFGITPGSSTLISGQTKLGTLAGVSGKGYSFTINGEKFEFSANDTVSSMISKINSSKAGVKIAYSSMTDSFTMEASSTGAQYGINITQESGNLMSVLFGSDKIKSAENAASSRLNTSSITAAGLSDGYKTSEASMTFKVNGKDYTFSLPKRKEGDYTKAEVEKNFNEWLKSTFGESNDVANISYSNGKLTTAAGYLVSFDKTKIDTSNSEAMAEAVKTDLALAFGFSTNGASNAVTEKTNISDIPALSGLTFYKEDG
ncbi:MAG: flagellar cap protein FliD N-terminal domain-containing protein, partial [Oscillospiraceae bacterium]